jgi:hypothetical protein
LVIALLTLGVTETASAQDGSSDVPAVNQYVETVPTGRGDVAPASTRDGARPLPKRVARAIERGGGAQSAQLQALATAQGLGAPEPPAPRPQRAESPSKGSSSGSATGPGRQDVSDPAEPVGTDLASATTKAIGGAGGGLGLLLAVMLVMAGAFIGFAARGRRDAR